MRPFIALTLLAALAACVPTTKYEYVPLTKTNFEAAQNGDKIPLVALATAFCFADGRVELVNNAEWTDEGICVIEPGISGEDERFCYGPGEIVGVGIPYEGRSASVIPMASVDVGECDPDTFPK